MTEIGYVQLAPLGGKKARPIRFSPTVPDIRHAPAADHQRSPQYQAALTDAKRWLADHEKAVKAQRILWRQVAGLPAESAP